LALMIAWSRSAMARSGSGIAAIFASTALSPSTLSARGPGRAAAFFAACLVVLLALRLLSVIFRSLSLNDSRVAGDGHPSVGVFPLGPALLRGRIASIGPAGGEAAMQEFSIGAGSRKA